MWKLWKKIKVRFVKTIVEIGDINRSKYSRNYRTNEELLAKIISLKKLITSIIYSTKQNAKN
jgi:hypothetical protein